uniref:HNH endonuclease n=1 Tax=Pithovirus LCPAC403 TaxID=2506596 RepID=A0A481ZCZ0_9VIRU|nr:MAG: HNH endonuclease [Pithovirus LCPAC403]
MVTQCIGITKQNKQCLKIVKKGNRCYLHPENSKGILYPTEEPVVEFKESKCPMPDCDKLEVWRWFNIEGFSRYMCSNHGGVYNVMTKKFLKGSPNAHGYIVFGLTKDGGKDSNIKSHTIIGSLFYGLKLGRDEINITMDHINKIRKHNYACNLRLATKSEQNRNRNHLTNNKGKIVFKLSSDGKILQEYMSVKLAAVNSDANVCCETMIKHCRSGNTLRGFQYRYKTKEDMKGHTWKSSTKLYPYIQPPFEISDKGWIYKSSGILTNGSKNGLYLVIGIFNNKKGKKVTLYIHSLMWTIFNNRLVPEGYELSHEDGKGTHNWLSNIKLRTHGGPNGNMMITVKNRQHKTAIQIRKLFHDGTYIDYLSISLAAKANKHVQGASRSNIMRALQRENKVAGLCKCGKKLTWKIIKNSNVNS